jgi:adenosine deaminase
MAQTSDEIVQLKRIVRQEETNELVAMNVRTRCFKGQGKRVSELVNPLPPVLVISRSPMQQPNSQNLLPWIINLPKIELHAHLNGSFRETTLKSLYEEKYQRTLQLPQTRTTEDCFNIFALIHRLVDNVKAIKKITSEVIEDFAAENVVYLELRTTPKTNPLTKMSKEDYIEAVLEAMNETMARSQHRIIAKLILSINRAQSLEEAIDTVQLALRFKHKGVVGIDFSGNPNVSSFVSFLPALQLARGTSRLPITAHFAETDNPIESKIILDFRPERLGHACCLDTDLFSYMQATKIPLEICLTSNLKSQTVKNLKEHPFLRFYKEGYPITLSTDDKGLFSITLSHEYLLVASEAHLSKSALFDISFKSIDYIFSDDYTKEQLRQYFSRRKPMLLEQ